jgi:hypothetical protein
MKTLLISICICVVLSLGAFCQDKFDVDIRLKDKASLSYHGKPGSDKFLPGQEMKIVNVFTSVDGFVYIVNCQSEKYELPFNRLDNIEFMPASDLLGEWEIQMVKYGALMNVAYKGMQFDLRKELNEEAYDFTSTLENSEFLFRDDYLEDYLQKLVHRIHPCILHDGRPGIIGVRVVKNQKRLRQPLALWQKFTWGHNKIYILAVTW